MLQVFCCLILLALTLISPAFRQWLGQRRKSELILAGSIIALLLIGHALCLGKYTFPFVNWSMYSTVNEEPQFLTVEIQLANGKGTLAKVNPIEKYPSMVHCFGPRFTRLVTAAEQGKLTPHGEQVYNRLIRGFAERQEVQATGADRLQIYLVKVNKSDRRRLEERLVSEHRIDRNDWTPASHSNSDAFPGAVEND